MGKGVFFGILHLVILSALSGSGNANPEFAAKTDKGCTFCHGDNLSKLNDAGAYYKQHNSLEGYTPGVVTVQSTRHFGENCQTCHTDKMDEWKASRHASSYTSSAFQDGILNLPEEQIEKCKNCHTTKADDTLVESVACVACHSNPTTVAIDDPVGVCRRCHSQISGVLGEERGKATARMNNEFERWSFAKHSNATGRLLESVEFNALETNSQRLLCLSCHSTDFRLVDGEIKIVDGDIGCIACHGGVNPQDEINNVGERLFDNYADARRDSLKKVDHTYTVPSSDFCGNCHTGYHHPQHTVWKTGEHASVACVKCHGETVSRETHELDMDHTFMVNYRACGECHDATTRIEKWQSLADLENEAFRAFYEANGKLTMALGLGVSKVYVGEAQKKLNNAREQLGVARNVYFHNQKQMKGALTNATALSEESNIIIENAILDFKTAMKTIAIVTTFLIAGAVAIVIIFVNMWQRDHKIILPAKRRFGKLKNIKSLPPKERKLYILGATVTIAAVLLFNGGFALYSHQPSFCVNCHIMKPMLRRGKNPLIRT